MTCRAIGSLSCTTNGAPTGQVLGYDALRRLISWQNASSLPTATAAYAYDGEGNRVWQQTVSGPGGAQTTATTLYLLGHDEQTTTQPSGQQATSVATRYYPTPGGALAVRDTTGLSYLATDHLGTPIATVNLDAGALLGEQFRAPYGEARYSVSANNPNGGMHTTFGFTGQREDTSSSGLTYFNNRFYDPAVGRFSGPDSLVGSDPFLNGYTYVGGLVVTQTDSSGLSPDDVGGSGVPDEPPGATAGELLCSLVLAVCVLQGQLRPYIPKSVTSNWSTFLKWIDQWANNLGGAGNNGSNDSEEDNPDSAACKVEAIKQQVAASRMNCAPKGRKNDPHATKLKGNAPRTTVPKTWPGRQPPVNSNSANSGSVVGQTLNIMETATQKVANAGIHGLESGADLVSAVSAAYTAMGTITGVVSSFWNWLQTPIAKSSSGDSGGQNLPWVQPCACGGWSGSSSGSGSSSSDGPSDIPDVPEVPWAA